MPSPPLLDTLGVKHQWIVLDGQVCYKSTDGFLSYQFQRNFEVIVSEIREIKADIREIKVDSLGLQRENRRILDHLFGRQGNEESEN